MTIVIYKDSREVYTDNFKPESIVGSGIIHEDFQGESSAIDYA